MYKEDFSLEYTNQEDLCYYDMGLSSVELYLKDKFVGDLFIYKDVEMKGREYIIINNEVTYLDTIKEM